MAVGSVLRKMGGVTRESMNPTISMVTACIPGKMGDNTTGSGNSGCSME